MSILKAKVFWPLVISSSNRVVYYKTAGVDYSVNIATGTYLSAALFAAAIQTAMASGTGLAGILVTVNTTTGILTFNNASAGGTFQFRWTFTTNTARALLGFHTNADTSLAVSQSGTCQHPNGWYSPTATAEDSLPIRNREMDVVTRSIAGNTTFFSENELTDQQWLFRYLGPEYTYIAFEGSTTDLNKAIERWWNSGRSQFRYWPDAATEGTYADYVLDQKTIEKFLPKRMFPKKALYEVSLGAYGYV